MSKFFRFLGLILVWVVAFWAFWDDASATDIALRVAFAVMILLACVMLAQEKDS